LRLLLGCLVFSGLIGAFGELLDAMLLSPPLLWCVQPLFVAGRELPDRIHKFKKYYIGSKSVRIGLP
jgi:hypothetical protein